MYVPAMLRTNHTVFIHITHLLLVCQRYHRQEMASRIEEQQLGIPRQLWGISGWDAVLLWQRYQNFGDQIALESLLQYNKEDVMNLKMLREKLDDRRGIES